ncbi:hypothetical protein AB833_10830 [Chromatiales bacterium (ex Bugula neritina AB1)]|nr:hypothetical protein AB833_10830 [Chromatiales bacterium (ex Bugula neritina AB1)]
MTESDEKFEAESLKDSLNRETATVDWQELVRHFARGVLIKVDASLDLIDVAYHMAVDDADALKQMLDEGTVMRVSDDDARSWNQRSPRFWCVVSAPWVLVQEQAGTSLH